MNHEKAAAGAWLAVAAGTIGALLATLDISIVNASLPTIQGEIGASGSEGTWISTAYLVAEIVMIPLAGWFQSIFGLRGFLLIATVAFTLCSMWCGISGSLLQMILGRVGQGFTGGAMIPTAMTIVATRLPPRQQPVGVALFGMTAVLGPVLGPVVGGWLTENMSWHYAFFLNLPIGIGLLALLILGLPRQKTNWGALKDTDVLGLAGLTFGLGALTVMLEEGQKERWFESPMICALAVVAALGFVSLFAGQALARRPIIQLKILRNHSFAGVFVMSLVLGSALYGILYLVPQFLAAVPGYNTQQSGYVTAVSGVPTILMLALFPLLVRRIDVRVAVAFGMFLYALSCLLDAHATGDTAGGQFFWTQVMRGFAQFFSMLFLNQAATVAVGREFAEDASGLFNAARNLGGSFGLAIATLQDRRMNLHAARLSEAVSSNSIGGQQFVQQHGLAQLGLNIQAQSLLMTFNDLFWVFGVALLIIVPLAMLLRPVPADPPLGVH